MAVEDFTIRLNEGHCRLMPRLVKTLPTEKQELYEGIVIVNFVPTSENLSKWFFDIVKEKMTPLNVKTKGVQFFETPKSSSCCVAQDCQGVDIFEEGGD